MERIELENNIKWILKAIKNEKLEKLLEKSIKNFSDLDLEKIFQFLQTWDKSMLLQFIWEKTKEAMWEVQIVKLAKWKIIIWKNSRIENAEKKEEEKELENLLNQL